MKISKKIINQKIKNRESSYKSWNKESNERDRGAVGIEKKRVGVI